MDTIRVSDGNSENTRPVRRAATANEPRPRPDERGPLSYAQRRLWFLDRWLGDSPAYNVPVTLCFSGPLDAGRLVAALTSVVARHDVVFTVFEEEGGEPRQRLLGGREPDCPLVDLTAGDLAGLDLAERRARAGALIGADARRPFDLSAGPMLRTALYRLAEDEHWLHLTWHHIACDGWSLDVFQRQLLEAYREGAPQDGPPPLRYADYALWQRERLAEPWTEKVLASWREALGSAPALLDLGADHARPAELSYKGRTVGFELSVPARELEEFAAGAGVSLYMVLLAAFQAVAARHAGTDDIVLGSPVAGRDRAALDELVGMFVDLLVVRTGLEDDPSFRELVARIRSSVLDALSRGRVPFDLAVNELHPERSLAHNPIVQVVFAYHEEEPAADLGGGLAVERRMVPTDTAKFDLTWSVHRRPDGLRLEVEYATDLYELSTIEVLAGHWQELLRHALAAPDVPVSRLEVMPPAERALVASLAGQEAAYPAGTIHGLVARQSAATPDAVAVVCGEERLTYRELNARANALAHHLRTLGVGPEVPVAVCVERSAETVIATLAVMKAAGVYVPLDTGFPAERMQFMLRDVGARLVLVAGGTGELVPEGPWQPLDLDELPRGGRHDDPEELAGPDNGCYVIFTSGSTGRPKGTLVTHANVTRLFQATAAAGLDAGPADVWTLFHSFAFDFSVWEMWGALTTGGRLVVVPHAVTRDTEAFYQLVHREHVTVLSQTPSAFRQFETTDDQTRAELALRAVVFGGEALHQPSVRRWADRHGYRTPRLINMYGITETTVHVTYLELAQDDLGGAVSRIGRPLPDLRVHVLDPYGRPCPIGVAGEIHVAGAGVTRGYVGRAALTAERFIPDHLSDRPGSRLYRTGDLARWTAGGRLEYLGRADAQVKIRGHRIELGEIEATLQTHPAVLEAVVRPHRGADDQTDLAAYVVAGGNGGAAGELRAWLGERLPGYMVPRWFVFLDALPLTAQGKVDRRALPEPSTERPELTQEYVAPLPGEEAALAAIWGRVLEVDRVGRYDNFFDLGGDSIRSIQVLGQARDAGFTFSLQDLFRHPVLADLAAITGDSGGEDLARVREPFALLSPQDRERLPEGLVDAYPMAELQIGMVYEMELDPDRRPYHNVDSLHVIGPFDEAKFRDAVARVVERHPILRTSFDLSGYSEPLQFVHATAEMPFTVVDLRGSDPETQESVIAAYIDTERGHRFDHSRPLLLRFGIHRLTDDAFQWTITEHHAIFDGWSLHSTISEMSATYQRLLAGEDPVLEPLRSSYRDFIAAERAALESADSEGFWLELLADRPDSRLPRWPADRPAQLTGQVMEDEWRAHNEAEGYGSIETLLPADVCAGIHELAKAWGVPFKAVVLAAHLRVISLVTGGSDVLVGLTANGRLEEADATDVRGMFLNTVPFRLRLPEGSWRDLVQAVFEAERELLPHRRYPLSALQRKHGGALFEVNFVYNHFHVLGKAFGADRMRIVDNKIDSFSTSRVEPTNFPLNVGVIRNPYSSRLLLALDYHTDVLTQDQVALMRDYYLRVFEAMVAEPDASHQDAPLLGEAERGVLASWNDTAAEVPSVLAHELVEARAAATPDAVAVVAGDVSLTYAEVNARANRLAWFLREAGVGPDVCVGLCVERSAEMIVALLAIAKAGGVYVPLDAGFPAERLRLMLSEVGAGLVLTAGATTGRIPAGTWQVVDLDAVELPEEERNPDAGVLPDHGCYVIFTSGSTGRPKGVVTLHRNVTELLHGAGFLRLDETDRLLQLAPLPFDNSTFEVWAPLVAGARLVLPPPVDYTPADIAAWVDEHRINVLHATASLFALLVDHEPQLFDGLRRFLTGSETVSPRHAAHILARCPGLELVNCWGPTETTTFSVCGPYRHDTLPSGPLPLGNPLVNTEVWVLNEGGRVVPIGTPGELYVAGPCLARGYLNNPAMTADRFQPHPTRPGARLYRTGDRGMWSVDGRVEFLGRVDHMVKIRGYRVELGEVEAALRAHPLVRECAVVARAGESLADLAAYLVTDGDLPTGEVRAWLSERLPHYMVPRWFVLMDALPLTPRAKIDRAALPAPQPQRPSQADFDPPLPGLEEQLARIWCRVLGVDRVGRHDDFFDLGGDSIRSIQVLGQARDAGLTFSLQDQHRHPTLAELAGVVRRIGDEDRQAVREPFSLVSPEDRELLPEGLADAYPMAELQVGMVYEMELDPDRRPYHNVHSIKMSGTFHERRFRKALAWVVERHPILRTSFDLSRYSQPMQLVHPTAEIPLTVTDLRGTDDQETALAEHVRREHRNAFDLSIAPLCRMAVHILDDDSFQWTVTEHHAILDGWSLASTLAEIDTLYRTDDPPAMEPLRSTYGDFIAAERAALTSGDSRDFWLEQLADRPDSRLPRRPRSRREGGPGALRAVTPPELLAGLDGLAQRWKVPFKAVVLAAHLRVISLVTGSPDVLAGLTANGRLEEADGAEVRGLFLNSVPFRLRLPEGSWRDLVQAVFEAERELLPHRRYPLSAIQRELGGGALFEVNFVYNHFRQLGGPAEDATLTVTDPGADLPGVSRTHFPLVVAVSREPGVDGLRLELEYDSRELGEDQVAELLDYYLRVFEAMVTDPDASCLDVPLLGEEQLALLESWHGAAAEVPRALVHELVEARAAATPDAVAVVAAGGSLTYAELNARANRLAWFLREAGVGPEVCVGLCVERSAEMVVALLAVVKAGGVYVPLDPGFPAERLRLMLGEVRAPIVLTAAGTAARIPAGPWRTIDLDTVELPEEERNPDTEVLPDHACYVIFTSGSTGRPKGVVTLHRNVTELLHGGPAMTLRADDRLLQIATTSFDVATYEIWAPLAAGAQLVLPPPVDYTPADIAAWVDEHRITVLHATASLFALLVDHEPRLFDRLRRLLTGAETVSPGHAARILDRCPDLELVNCWGPTETTTFSVCGSFTRDTLPAGPLPLGVPLANTEVRVLDENGRPVPAGTPGELYVAGPCLARGYLDDPVLTADRFRPHPTRPGARLYRTGDRGRWSADGQVEFLGRVDHMVKVRGYRVELGEVETALRAHPRVRECVVLAHDDESGRTDLVAHIVPEGEDVPADELRRWLLERLPAFMAPRWFLSLAALPLTPRGKVDRRALPAPPVGRPELTQEFVAPLPGREEQLARIWCRVLGVDRVGRHDDFFDLGGDSIRSVQVLGKARELGFGFTLQELFGNPTIAGLAAVVRRATGRGPVSEPFSLVSPEDRELLPDGLADAYPMAELQVGMVYEMELDPDRRPYHNVHSIKMSGPFHERRFRRALAWVVERHPILRTSFDLSRYSEPMQLVHPTAEIPLTVTDLRGADDQETALAEHVRREHRDAFDLSSAPLCRMAVHILDDDAFHWTVTEHHAILDGWSLASTLAEIDTLYRTDDPPAVEPLRSTYGDFIAAERAALTSGDSRDFWLEQLADRPGSRLPRRDGPAARGIGETVQGERHEHDENQGHGTLTTPISRELLTRLEDFARRCGVPFKTVVLAAHLRALSLATGSPDVVTGLSSDGRLEEADATDARGLFLNTLPFRIRLPEGTWQDLARAVFDAERELLPHRRYPMSAMQRALGGPLFEVSFVYNHFHQFGRLAEDAPGGADTPGVGRTHFPLLVTISRENGGLRLGLEYDAREFSGDQAVTLRDYHLRALESMTADPEAPHHAVSLLGEAERELLAAWAGGADRFEAGLVHDLVARWAEATPDAVAVTCGDERISYGELDARADRLARRLRALGVGPEVCVGVCTGRSVRMVVAALAVLKAGGVYVPLDDGFPAERLRFMLADLGAPLVLTTGDVAGGVPGGAWRTLDVAELEAGGDAGPLPERLSPGHGCYVIFTSGSTGRPKGTLVTHANVTRLFQATAAAGLDAGPADVWTLFHSFAFDFSVWEMWGALTTGGRVVVAPHEVTRDTEAFYQLVRREQITVLSQTPSAFRQFETVDARLQAELALRLVIFGGEALHQPSVRRWADRHGYHTPRLINMYGITETTVHVTHLELTEDDLDRTASRIGRPLPDLRIHVLDPYGQPSPIGVAGEIHIAGAGLTRGYIERAALTAERFVPGRTGDRLYRSGDLARWSHDGVLEYLGRADTQVKVRGHRIETGEVEAALGSHPAILEAVVTLHDTDLVAYVVSADQAVSTDALRAWLAGRLPDYMAPRWFVFLDALPLTAQGKVDRAALPAPSGERPELAQEYVPPLPGPEEALAGIWRRVLGVDRVGRHDDFFDLGGDSIRSIQILGQARELGLGFDLQELFRHPTLAALTRIAGGMPEPDLERLSGGLVHGGRERPGAGETAVRLGGTPGLRPLVLVHPVGGTLFCYLELAGRVGSAFEVLGVQGDVLGSGGGTADLGELAERYARDLTPLLDGRRPVIAGWSAGGVIAHELAVRLERQGVEAHRLVLIDAHQRRDAADTAEAAALDALRADVLRRGSEAVKDALADTGFHDLLATLGIDEATLAGLDGGAVAALMAFWRDMLAGLAGHRPSRFGGAAELLLARDGTSPEATAAEWRALTGSLTVTHVDGGHFELLREPSVAAVAETLRGSAERMGD